jgi:hypothetical protein
VLATARRESLTVAGARARRPQLDPVKVSHSWPGK